MEKKKLLSVLAIIFIVLIGFSSCAATSKQVDAIEPMKVAVVPVVTPEPAPVSTPSTEPVVVAPVTGPETTTPVAEAPALVVIPEPTPVSTPSSEPVVVAEASAPAVVAVAETPAPVVVAVAEIPAPVVVAVAEAPAPVVVAVAEAPVPAVVAVAEAPAPVLVAVAEAPAPVLVATAEAPVPAIVPAAGPVHMDKLVRLITTSDMHGSIFPYDFKNNVTAKTSLMQIATYVDQERAKKQSVLLFDAGDVLQGQPLVYYYNFVNTADPHIVPAIMNDMGYDAAAVGNHDIEAGPDVYIRAGQQAKFPYLAANAVSITTGQPVIYPYTVVVKDGLKIAVIGMTTPYIPKWLPQNLYEGIRFEDMIVTAKKWIPIIQAKEKPDMIVGLFHAGVDETYSGTAQEIGNENASKLVAQQVEGFDIIFTGHDHQDTNMVVQSPSGKNVLILGAMNAARSVAAATARFAYDSASGTYRLASVEGKTEMMDGYAPSKVLMDTYAAVQNEVTQWTSRQIGTISETVSSRDSMFGDSKFVDLIHTLQLEQTGAQISISAPLSLDTAIKQGAVYVRDMFNLYPYENLLFTMEMTGREIKAFMEFSYEKWFNQMKSLDDDLINFKRDKEGNLVFNSRYNTYDTTTRYYNYDSFAGLNYVVDITKPAGQRITVKTMASGERFQIDKTYKVAINSYRAQGGGGHLAAAGISPELALERTLSSTVKDLRFYLMEAFEKKGEIVPAVDNNWLVIPSLWVQRGIKNSYPKLFGVAK